MPIGPRQGKPCTRCPESRPGQQPHDAIHYGHCMLCWLGATERQRRDARFAAGESNGGPDAIARHRSAMARRNFAEYCARRDAATARAEFADLPVAGVDLPEPPDPDPDPDLEQHGEQDVAA